MDGHDPQDIDIPDSNDGGVVQDGGWGNDTPDPGEDYQPVVPDERWEDTGLGEFGEDETKTSGDIIIYDFGGETRNLPDGEDE